MGRPRTRLPEFAAGAAVLAAAAVAAAWDLAGPARPDAAAGEAFRRATAGAGAGPAIDLSACPAAFDPRDDDACPNRDEPVPCGDVLCPHLGGFHGAGGGHDGGSAR